MPVARVREPETPVPSHGHVADRVKAAAVEIGHHGPRRRVAWHQVEAAGAVLDHALDAKQDTVVQVGTAPRHVDARRGPQLCPFHRVHITILFRAAQLYPGHQNNREVCAAAGLEEVGGDVQLVVLWDEHAPRVKQWILGGRGCRREEGVLWRSANEATKGVMMLCENDLVYGSRRGSKKLYQTSYLRAG